ncbi:MAG: YbbR-like domain-containing protein [Deltaproteobacteria bacterium]|nr:YbbR-like domain-containing protein [Deltaproteobacteria bacterium]
MKELILKNLRLKLLALGFSLALWFFVASQTSTDVGFMVPLSFKGIPKGMVMTGAPEGEVDVRVAGPKFLVNNLLPSQIIAEVDLASAKEGVNGYRIPPRDVTVPAGIKVTRVIPASVEIRMDRLVEVELPVKVRLSGKPGKGWRVARVSVTPRSVTAGVVKKNLDVFTAVYTKPVDISGARARMDVTAQLEIPDNDIRALSVESVKVKVIFEKEK